MLSIEECAWDIFSKCEDERKNCVSERNWKSALKYNFRRSNKCFFYIDIKLECRIYFEKWRKFVVIFLFSNHILTEERKKKQFQTRSIMCCWNCKYKTKRPIASEFTELYIVEFFPNQERLCAIDFFGVISNHSKCRLAWYLLFKTFRRILKHVIDWFIGPLICNSLLMLVV